MAQLNYNANMEIGQAGQLADMGYDNCLTYRAVRDINFGVGVVQFDENDSATLPSLNKGVLTFDADLVTSNTINLKVNGVSIAEVTYATSHTATLAAVAAAITALTGITASVTAAREITVFKDDGAEVSITDIVVAGGASQAGGTVVYSGTGKFVGVAVLSQAIEQNADGVALYVAKSPMSVLSRGRVYVRVENEVKPGDAVYMRNTAGVGESLGHFRNDADSGDAILINSARFTRGAAAGKIAVLEVNLP